MLAGLVTIVYESREQGKEISRSIQVLQKRDGPGHEQALAELIAAEQPVVDVLRKLLPEGNAPAPPSTLDCPTSPFDRTKDGTPEPETPLMAARAVLEQLDLREPVKAPSLGGQDEGPCR
jgi:hypothetical protein